jgi:hypothetical protein
MAEIVNLRLARKARRRAKAAGAAAENRARSGRSAAERRFDRVHKAAVERKLDSHRLDSAGDRDRTRGPE